MKKNKSFRVLIAPLDWGLGHTTRCIPIIQNLLRCNCDVVVACNPVAKHILQTEFPHLEYISLRGYEIKYAVSKWKFTFKIGIQIPKILMRIRSEHRWLKAALETHNIDLVISDNRYGLYHKTIPSIFITHQLQVQTPLAFLTRFLRRCNYHFINRFPECWVPDYSGKTNLAGQLSHPEKLPSIPLFFIGPLSRFLSQTSEKKRYKWMMILSGPEPMRTVLENKCIQVVKKIKDPVLFVRGLPNAIDELTLPSNCTVFNHLPTGDLEKAFLESEYIISRSGYTTVMEIISLQKKSVLIPTPGQTEQEYLAQHLYQQHWCYTLRQEEDLLLHLQLAEEFNYIFPSFINQSLQNFLEERIIKIKASVV